MSRSRPSVRTILRQGFRDDQLRHIDLVLQQVGYDLLDIAKSAAISL